MAFHFSWGSELAKAVSNQAMNCALAPSPCSLDLEPCPPFWVLVALKLPSRLQNCWLTNMDPPLAAGNGLYVTLSFESCVGGLMRYSQGPNTLLGMHGCPSHLLALGQVSEYSIPIIELILFQICSSSDLPHSPSRAHQNNTLLVIHKASQKFQSVKAQMKLSKLESLLRRPPNVLSFRQ